MDSNEDERLKWIVLNCAVDWHAGGVLYLRCDKTLYMFVFQMDPVTWKNRMNHRMVWAGSTLKIWFPLSATSRAVMIIWNLHDSWAYPEKGLWCALFFFLFPEFFYFSVSKFGSLIMFKSFSSWTWVWICWESLLSFRGDYGVTVVMCYPKWQVCWSYL